MLSGLVNVVLFTTTRKIIPARDARALFSRSKLASDIESQKSVSSTATLVTPFVVAEKASVSPMSEAQTVSIPVPVTVPVPAMQDPRPPRMIVPKRGASLAPTVASVYSQKSAKATVAPLKPKSSRKSIRQSIIAPLKVVKKSSLRKPTPALPEVAVPKSTAPSPTPEEREEDLGHRESWSDESSSRYSNSSYASTAPLRQSRPLPTVPPKMGHHHSKSSSSTSSYRAPGTPF